MKHKVIPLRPGEELEDIKQQERNAKQRLRKALEKEK
jgi:hypothetical protein